jgi:glutamine---fructose-6-phosphate transaminase (isomerizing)
VASLGGEALVRAEMAEQPGRVAALLASPAPQLERLASWLRERPPKPVVLVGRGSSANVGLFVRYLLEAEHRLLTCAALPASVTLLEGGPQLGGAVVLAISQSGQSEDLRLYLEAARQGGAHTAAVVNAAQSPLAQAAELVVPLSAGEERAVPATKRVTAGMAVMLALSAKLGREGSWGPTLAAALTEALAQTEAARALAQRLVHAEGLLVVGRGYGLPVAQELALKLKEMAGLQAEALSAAELRHGPIAVCSPRHRVLVVDLGGQGTSEALQTARAVERQGAEAYLLRAGDFRRRRDAPALVLRCPLPPPEAALVAVVLGQELALQAALLRQRDPASPPGLRKVTRTR